ncbi:unnamed protein product [Protopolystoma xenopodis]|uniref:Uncharacterized protein n=1 Tax=Protopolystoma xenopodis TaxID=117903 RepID=A0A3S4ZJI0_9PLAT|nr:unnamed protein product [Protopolystoma xenopodis]
MLRKGIREALSKTAYDGLGWLGRRLPSPVSTCLPLDQLETSAPEGQAASDQPSGGQPCQQSVGQPKHRFSLYDSSFVAKSLAVGMLGFHDPRYTGELQLNVSDCLGMGLSDFLLPLNIIPHPFPLSRPLSLTGLMLPHNARLDDTFLLKATQDQPVSCQKSTLLLAPGTNILHEVIRPPG